ncbi:MAG: 4Fe-4S binding protein [Candidatus Pacebacteria bacterium]|nr:4Fe-4S binding protein [Candidatus Paceibacterota bacterium]
MSNTSDKNSRIQREMGQKDLDHDPKKAADAIKRQALALGADSVGIGNIERWANAPTQMDPKQIMPECKSIIAMAFRVMRGSMRGIEEGTFFSNYSSMGYGGITYLYMPMTVINLCKYIEDRGYEALPMGHQSDWRGIDAYYTGAQGGGRLKRDYSRPVAPGRAAPDVMIHLRIAGYLCGLGEIGYSMMLLTPEFGPRNRIGVILTDVELEPDPIYDGPQLCNRCMACVRDCPTGAISRNETVKLNLAGNDVEFAKIDCDACNRGFRGAEETGRELPEDKQYMNPTTKPGFWSPFHKKPHNLYNTGQAVGGARGCTRACMVQLEKRGVLRNKFKDEFRRRPEWRVDWSTDPEYPADVAMPGEPVIGEGGNSARAKCAGSDPADKVD